MKREELISSKEYWLTKIQLDLFSMIETYRKENNLNRTQLANKLGVTKGYITQILNGDFDHRVSKLVELAIFFGKVPVINFMDAGLYRTTNVNNPSDYNAVHQTAVKPEFKHDLIVNEDAESKKNIKRKRSTK